MGKGIIYPSDIYRLTYDVHKMLAKSDVNLSGSMENSIASGEFLFSNGDSISEETYNCLWQNILLICNKPFYLKKFWGHSYSYFRDFQGQNDEKKPERDRFLEFHYAFGGLMLYKQQYGMLDYMFSFTESQPPHYYLLPETMNEIFEKFMYFAKDRNSEHKPFNWIYPFPEIDNLGESWQVKDNICKYIALLFIRQYTLTPYLDYHKFTEQPDLPDNLNGLNFWQKNVQFFKDCYETIISNKELISTLNFDKAVTSSNGFIATLKDNITKEISKIKQDTKLSEEKVNQFKEKSTSILTKVFDDYKDVFNKKQMFVKDDLTFCVNGIVAVTDKTDFIDGTNNADYDTFYANTLAEKLQYEIPTTFMSARTDRYLFDKEDIISVLKKIIGKQKDIVIVIVRRINPFYKTQQILNSSIYKEKIIEIGSTNQHLFDTLFVLRKSDLPSIEIKDLEKSEIDKFQLEKIIDKKNVYASVIETETQEGQEPQVQVTIALSSVIHWKKGRKVVQINVVSEYKEQGIKNSIKDIKPLKI